MKKIFPTLTILLILTLNLSFAQVNLITKLTDANNDFGFRLFSELIKHEGVKNTFISPTSISIALAMTYNGAESLTKDSMAKTLSITDFSINEFNQANLQLRNSLTKKNNSITLMIANSLWADQGTEFKKDFLATNKKYFDAKLTTLDFTNPKSVLIINNWVRDVTNFKIKKIIEEIGEDVVAFLIDAIYFKADWLNEFDKTATKPDIFYCLDGTKKELPMMYQQEKYGYFENDKFQAISLPYADENLKMDIFLPKKSSDIKEFLSNLNLKTWKSYQLSFTPALGEIFLPRFKLEYEKSLKDALKAIGMEIAFNDSANFIKMASSKIKGPIYIGDVKHKTFVEVSEQGTEAAAVTAVQMEVKGAPINKFSMKIDRPFFCAIVDAKTKAILFIGVVTELK